MIETESRDTMAADCHHYCPIVTPVMAVGFAPELLFSGWPVTDPTHRLRAAIWRRRRTRAALASAFLHAS
jgi:hypothetical protein